MNLLQMKSGDLIDPSLIHAVVKFPNKGVIFRNEYNKVLCFEAEKDNARQEVIVKEIAAVLYAGKNWQQPDWNTAFAKVDKPAPAAPAKTA